MLPEGINTAKIEIPKKNNKPVRLMEFILYPVLLVYIILDAFIINLAWNFGDFFLLDWWLRAVYRPCFSTGKQRA